MAQTSLARQLQKLAAPQTSAAQGDQKRASFLFDPREAAALDTDTAYAIGTTGLEELTTLNEAFARFEENLFSESAKFLERAVKSKEENAILDGQIEEFLLLLSPHFLLRPAHKALEWLVYRFHVHEFNMDAILRCILPFHETRVFARALQLLDLSSKTSKWHWLHCLQKPGLSLTKTALVTQCTRDPGTLKFVCEVLVAMAKVHSEDAVALRPVIGLYASAVLGTLEAMKKITDQTVAMLLPYILKGLASSAIPDHRAATYLVVGQLARRTVLNREFSHELVVRVAKSIKAPGSLGANLSEGLLCLLVLMTLQNIQDLPKAAFQALMKHKKSLVAALEELSSRHSVSAILKPLLAQLTNYVLEPRQSEGDDASKKAAVLKALIQLALSLDKYSDYVVRLFFDAYIKLHKSRKAGDSSAASNSANDEVVLDIMKMLRQRCPDEVDACLECHLCGDDEQARLAAEQLTRTNAFGREHAVVEAAGSALFLALNSGSKHHRLAAVRELVASLQKKQDVEEKFARESLRSRLADTEPEVVQAVLALGKDLCNFVEQSFVLNTLKRILFEPAEESTKWFDLRTRALAFVCDDLCAIVDEGQLLATLLPFLMPTEKSEISLARVAYASRALPAGFPMFKTVTTDKRMAAALGAVDLDTITELLLANIAETVGKVEQPLALVKTLEELCFPSTGYAAAQLRCICCSLLNGLASSTKNAEVLQEALRFYRRLLAEKAACGEYEFAVAAVRDGRVPSAMVISGLTAVINGVKPVAALKDNPVWVLKRQDKDTQAALDILTDIFETIAENSLVKSSCRLQFRQLLQKFFKVHCHSLQHQVHFLSGLWLLHLDAICNASSSGSQGAPAAHPKERLQSLALAVSIQLLRDAEGIKWILAEKNLVFLSIILSLLSPTQGIRDLAVSLVEASVACSQKGRTGLHALFELIADHAADVSVGTKKLLKLVASWHATLKKPNMLLALLNHEQVPVAMRCGILKLVSRVDSEEVLEAAVKVIATTLGLEACDVAPTLPLPSAETQLLRECFAKYGLGAVQRLANVEGAVETFEKALRSTRRCEGDESVATMALQVVTKDLALRKVCSFGSLLVEPLQRISTSRQSPAKTVREAKKMRLMDAAEEQDPAESPQWKRILILLEMIQSRKSIEDVSLLVAPLYTLLKRSLDLNQSPHVEYLRQCVLTALQAHGLSAPRHELATLVKCLRQSESAQAQQLSLALLNLAAQKYPEEVLHNVTSVFTFMGGQPVATGRQLQFSNSHANSRNSRPSSASGLCWREQVCRGFGNDHLWVLAAQMAGHHVTKMAAAMDTDESTSNILEFGLSLCGQFEVSVQMQTITHLLKFAASLPAVKDNDNEPPSHPEVFDMRLYSEKQLQRFRLSIANFVADLLGSSTFLGQMAVLQGGKGDGVSRWSHSPTKTPYQERAWKALLSKLHDVVHKVNGLLPSGQFVSVVRSLMCHELSSIRRSAMDMLNEKLAAKDYFAEEDTQSLLELVPLLLQMAHGKSLSVVPSASTIGSETSGATSSEEAALNRQTALLSLKLLIRTLGAEHRDAFAEVFDLAHQLLSDKAFESTTDE
ncbi:hypothetical protein MRX96_002399 [Rhipicephalus microplus]